MKVLFVNPPYDWDTSASTEGVTPPLGMLYLAAVLKCEGHDAELLDVRAMRLGKREVMVAISKSLPDIVAIGAMTNGILQSYDIANFVKEVDRSIIVLQGGVHISALPERTMNECNAIDYGLIGEGEATIAELVDAIEGRKKIDDVDGVIYRKRRARRGALKMNAPRKLIKNLDKLPFPARDLLSWEHYTRSVHRTMFSRKVNSKYTSMVTSRGCPYGCVYCDKSVFGRGWRPRSPENVVLEIEHVIEKYGVGELTFYDDLFTFDKKRAMKICDMILERGIDISWAADARVDTVDQELLERMREAGCNNIFFGVETGDARIMENIDKRITLEQVRKATGLAKTAGIGVTVSFMFGLPGETRESAMRTIGFAKSIDADIAHFNITIPFPGSPFFKKLENEGRLLTYDWSRYNPHRSVKLFEHENLSFEEIDSFHNKAYSSFYLRPKFILPKIGQFMRNPAGFVRGSISFAKILAKKGN